MSTRAKARPARVERVHSADHASMKKRCVFTPVEPVGDGLFLRLLESQVQVVQRACDEVGQGVRSSENFFLGEVHRYGATRCRECRGAVRRKKPAMR